MGGEGGDRLRVVTLQVGLELHCPLATQTLASGTEERSFLFELTAMYIFKKNPLFGAAPGNPPCALGPRGGMWATFSCQLSRCRRQVCNSRGSYRAEMLGA